MTTSHRPQQQGASPIETTAGGRTDLLLFYSSPSAAFWPTIPSASLGHRPTAAYVYKPKGEPMPTSALKSNSPNISPRARPRVMVDGNWKTLPNCSTSLAMVTRALTSSERLRASSIWQRNMRLRDRITSTASTDLAEGQRRDLGWSIFQRVMPARKEVGVLAICCIRLREVHRRRPHPRERRRCQCDGRSQARQAAGCDDPGQSGGSSLHVRSELQVVDEGRLPVSRDLPARTIRNSGIKSTRRSRRVPTAA